MTDIAIRVENLSKQYRIGGPQGRSKYKSLREELVKTVQAPFRRLSSVVRGQSSAVSNETIWALKDVSFEVQRGEVVGVPALRRRYRPQRGGEDHAAQDSLPHHRTDGGLRRGDGGPRLRREPVLSLPKGSIGRSTGEWDLC